MSSSHYSTQSHHVNVVDDVVSSGILSVLSARPCQFLLMLAGYAHRDSDSINYRTAFCIQDDGWAEKLA